MPDLEPLSPLPALAGVEPGAFHLPGLSVAPGGDTALASVAARRGQEDALAEALADFIGAGLPGPGRLVRVRDMMVFWLGPQAWMVAAPVLLREQLAADLKTRLADRASVTEQSGAWARIEVSGARTPDLFERLCPLPVRRLGKGSANRTTIDHLGCLVLHEGGTVTVLGPRSSAVSLYGHMLAVAGGLHG